MTLARAARRRQRGQALLILAAILVLGVSWALISALSTASSNSAALRADNGRILAEAKAALIGWVAMNALDVTETNPGRLPCPQNWGDVGSANEGRTGNCSIAVGWLPWRSLGLPKPLDASGQQLWYVMSPGWYASAAASLDINSSTPGQLSLDGSPAVALIIAPGPALNIAPNANQSAAGCTARSQVQKLSLPATAPNPLDFLDCQNGTTADNAFTSSVIDNAANPVFNDQVVAITTADILPALEAAIARRIALQIAPVLSSVYADAKWGTSTTSPAFAFPAPFDDPTTSAYLGQIGCSLTSLPLCQGLLPFNYHSATCAADPRCSPDVTNWGTPAQTLTGGTASSWLNDGCSVSTVTPPLPAAPYELTTCSGRYFGGTVNISLTDPAADVTRSLRTFTTSDHVVAAGYYTWNGSSWVGPSAWSATASRSLAANGAANFIARGSFPSTSPTWGAYYVQSRRPTISDHPILDATNTDTGWFVRNEWYRQVYYAIAAPHAPGGTLNCSDTGTVTCLQVTNLADPAKQRAILALEGRALASLSQTRPSPLLQNYLDSAENRNLDALFEQLNVGRSFNDRFVSVSKKP